MGCDHVKLANGMSFVVCNRGRPRRARCQEPGCDRIGELLCDYPLAGAKAGKTCDRRLCTVHRVRQGPRIVPGADVDVDVAKAASDHLPSRIVTVRTPEEIDTTDFCPAHDRLANGGAR